MCIMGRVGCRHRHRRARRPRHAQHQRDLGRHRQQAARHPGTVYLGQNLRFVAPVRPGDTVHAMVKVAEVRPDKEVVHLETVCKVGDMLVITG